MNHVRHVRNRGTSVFPTVIVAFVLVLAFVAPASAQTVNIFGRDHSSTGTASLSVESGSLVVSNIGSSGLDGVSIDLGTADPLANDQEFLVHIDTQSFFNPGALPFGSYLDWLTIGPGLPGPNSAARVTERTTHLDLDVNLNLVGATTVTARYFLNGALVAIENGLPANARWELDLWPDHVGVSLPPDVSVCWNLSANVGSPSGVFHLTDHVTVEAEDPSPAFQGYQDLVVRGGNGFPPELRIDGEEILSQGGSPTPVLFSGFLHSPLGQATLDASGGTLTVSNIGSSGEDGVSIDVGELDLYEEIIVHIAPPPVLLPGMRLLTGLDLQRDGQYDWINEVQFIGPGNVQATLDFGLLPTPTLPTVRLDYFLGGNFLASEILPAPTVLLAFDLWPDSFDASIPPDASLCWSLAATVQSPTLGPILTDHVIAQAITSGMPVDFSGTEADFLCQASGGIRDLELTLVESVRSPGIDLFGHTHHALGQAQMNSSGGTLTVSNIGSSGCDGVSIDLGNTPVGQFEEQQIHLPPPGPLPPGAFFEVSAADRTGILWQIRTEETGPARLATADFSPLGATSVRVDYLLGGNVVFTEWQPGPQAGVAFDIWPDHFGLSLPPNASVCWDLSANAQVPGIGLIPTDHIIFTADNILPAAVIPLFSSQTLCRAGGGFPGTFVIDDEPIVPVPGLNTFGRDHFPLGQAQLTSGAGGTLVVSNIGSSGLDGVSIDLGDEIPPYHEFLVHTSTPGPPGSTPPGSNLTLGALDLSGRPVMNLQMTDNGLGQVVLDPDLGPLFPSGLRVRYLLGSTLVGSEEISGASSLSIPGDLWPDHVGVSLPPDVSVCWDLAANVVSPTLGPLSVDHIVVEALDPNPALAELGSLFLVAGGGYPGSLIIDLEEVVPVPGTVVEFGRNHYPLGGTQLNASGGTLTVSNIGSSGCDGVSIDLGTSLPAFEEFNVHFLNPVPPPAATVVVFSVRGITDESQSNFVDTGTLTVSAGPTLVSARPIMNLLPPTSTIYVRYFLAGTLLGVEPLPPTGGADFDLWPDHVGVSIPPDFSVCWNLSANTQSPTFGPLVVDHVTFTADAYGNGSLWPPNVFDHMLVDVTAGGTHPSQMQIVLEDQIPTPGGVSLFGHNHLPLGQAEIEDVGGRLKVSNLGSSGCDGVSIDLGDQGYDGRDHLLHLAIPGPPGFAPGSFLELTGHIDDEDSQSSDMFPDALLKLRIEDPSPGSNVPIDVEFDPVLQVSEIEIQYFLQGTLVGSEVQTGGVVGVSADLWPDHVGVSLPPDVSVCWNLSATVQTRTLGPVVADHVLFLGQSPAMGPSSQIVMALRAGGGFPDPIEIIDETIFDPLGEAHYAGRLHTALGGARLLRDGGNLVVSNIGSSGLDGVSIDLDNDVVPVQEFTAHIDQPDPDPPVGGFLEFQSFGTLNPLVPLATAHIERVVAACCLSGTVSVAGTGATHMEVRYLQAGGVVGMETFLPVSGIFEFDIWPDHISVSTDPDIGFCWNLPLQVRSPSGSTFFADHVIVSAQEAPTFPVEMLSMDLVAGGGWPCALTITAEEIQSIATGVEDLALPTVFNLAANYPNPFSPDTRIRYSLPETAPVNLQVFDLNGRRVKTLHTGIQEGPKHYEALWDGTDDNGRRAVSGVYFYRLKAGDFTSTRRMVLMR